MAAQPVTTLANSVPLAVGNGGALSYQGRPLTGADLDWLIPALESNREMTLTMEPAAPAVPAAPARATHHAPRTPNSPPGVSHPKP
jgi:hypothetical protein